MVMRGGLLEGRKGLGREGSLGGKRGRWEESVGKGLWRWSFFFIRCDDALPVFTFKLGQTAWVWVCVRTCVGVRSCACVRLVCLPAGRRSCLPPYVSARLSVGSEPSFTVFAYICVL